MEIIVEKFYAQNIDHSAILTILLPLSLQLCQRIGGQLLLKRGLNSLPITTQSVPLLLSLHTLVSCILAPLLLLSPRKQWEEVKVLPGLIIS